MRIFVTHIDNSVMVGGLVHAIAAQRAREAAYVARDTMLEQVPRDTGALADSITVQREDIGEYVVSAGGDEVDYAYYVEFGTYRSAARPFFTPGMEAGRQHYLMRTEV